MRILVVDDDFVCRKKMEVIMLNFGACDIARNGEEALNVFKNAFSSSSPFDVIALDISMPDIDGFKVLSEIRAIENDMNIEANDRVKVIMVTAKADKETVMTSIGSGCDDYVIKPVNWKVMFNKLVKLRVLKFAQW